MRTTTRDPNKKNPGDQGVEYSEYYSDNDDIISPEDIRARPKLDEMSRNSEEGQVRSVREAADGNLLDQNYYEMSDERSKRDDPRAVSVMEDPYNSMEYVDNTYGPAPVDQISPYINNYNYVPDQGPQFNNPAEIPGTGQQAFPNAQANFNQYPPVIESPVNKVPSMSINPMVNNVQPVVQEQTGLSGNVLSQLPQPHLAQDNVPRYSIGNMPLTQFSSPVASSVSTLQGKTLKSLDVIGGNVPEGDKLAKVSSSYDTSGEISRLRALGTTAKGISVAPSASPIDSFDSRDILSRLQDIKHQLAPDNIWAGGQIQSISSREVSSKKGKGKGSESKKSEAQTSTTPSEDTETKKHGASKASSHAASTSACTSQPQGIKNDTKAVASQILTEIIDELEQLRLENPKNEDKEGSFLDPDIVRCIRMMIFWIHFVRFALQTNGILGNGKSWCSNRHESLESQCPSLFGPSHHANKHRSSSERDLERDWLRTLQTRRSIHTIGDQQPHQNTRSLCR